MKYFYYVLIGIALVLIIYNVTLLDYSSPLEGDSAIAIIGILAAACAIMLVLILRTSKKIAKKKKY